MEFFHSGLGQYVSQTVFHSLIIAIVVEALISAWHIRSPSLLIKFRCLPLLLPLLYLPAYFLTYSTRMDRHFHQDVALLDSTQWLALRPGGVIALWHLFVAVLALTAGFFIVKEVVPTARYLLNSRLPFPPIEKGQFPKLDAVLLSLARATGGSMPALLLSPSKGPVIYSYGGKAIVISEATINMLDNEELEGVLAHEMGHVTRKMSRLNSALVVMRWMMFYSPVAILVFRRIMHDSEKACDDFAVSTTGKPLAVASGLLTVFRTGETGPARNVSRQRRRLSPGINALEDRACRELVKNRVTRLVDTGATRENGYENARLAVTAVFSAVLLFFVV